MTTDNELIEEFREMWNRDFTEPCKHNPDQFIVLSPIKYLDFLTQAFQRVREEKDKDKQRLDFLDKCNQALNKKYGTNYGWELIINQNITRSMVKSIADIDLNDARGGNGKLKSCRDAIDKVINSINTKD